jgi:glycosyltransferase involved in cell wall biosynthesis
MPGRIHILIGGHLSTAPRAQKEALALRDAGHDVRVSGVWFEAAWTAWDRALVAQTGIAFAPALDFRSGSWRREAGRTGVRLRARSARELFRRTGWFSPALLGYGARQLLAAALEAKADLTIVHSEAGLWVAQELLRRGRQVGIDFEDWFSRNSLAGARDERPVLQLGQMEGGVARQSRYVLAPSHAMAGALAHAYGIPAPTVVYNVFSRAERETMDGLRKDRLDPAIPSLHWFSQTIGPHRGLEQLFAALPLLKHRPHLYLRGACSDATRRWLQGHTPRKWRDRVTLLPLVSGGELLSRIAEHDLGMALEEPSRPNANLTVSNKLFQYLLAGLAVIASDTAGQREVLAHCGEAGTLLPEATPQALALAIDCYLDDPALLARARAAALRAASEAFCWEHFQGRVVALAASALER